jgi:thiol:disulfide interchange protein DsbA
MKKIVLLSLLLLFPLLSAAGPEFKEDMHYAKVLPQQPGGLGERIQVREFFWYGCGACSDLEPHLQEWLKHKPETVDFIRIPLTSENNPVIDLHARTYYVLELMGVDPAIHEKIFDVISKQGRKLKTLDEMAKFLAEEGVDVAVYRNTLNIRVVNASIEKAAKLKKIYDANRVPTVIVDGKYVARWLGGRDTVKLTEYLIDKVRREKMEQTAK